MRHAGLRAFLAIAGGVALQAIAHLPAWFLIVVLGLTVAAAFLTRGITLLLSLLLASALALGAQSRPVWPVPYSLSTRYRAVVLGEPIPLRTGRNYPVRLDSVYVAGRFRPLGLKARLSTGRRLNYGAHVEIKGTLLPFNYPRNPGLTDLSSHFLRQGFSGRIRSTSLKTTDEGRGDILQRWIIMPVRRHCTDVVGRYSSGQNRSLLAGLLLGEKADLPEESRQAFVRAGTMHILAVSGLNVAILVGACLLLLSALSVRGLAALVITAALTLVYVGITGFSASAVRAGLMALTAVAGLFLQRRYSPLNGLSIAGIAVLLADPASLLDIGFQLSFAATAAIVVLFPRLEILYQQLRPPRVIRDWLLSPLAVTCCAGLATLPLTAYYFHRLSVISPLSNLLVVPLVGIATPLAMLLVVVAPLSHLVASALAASLDLVLSAIGMLNLKLGSLPWASLTVAGFSPLVLVLAYCAVLLLAALLDWGLRFGTSGAEPRIPQSWIVQRGLALLTLAGLAAFAWSGVLVRFPARLTFLDTSEGEAAVLRLPGGRSVLIDAGTDANRIVPDFLAGQGAARIEVLVLTSLRPVNLRAAAAVLNELNVRLLLVPVDSVPDTCFTELLKTARNRRAAIAALAAGDEVRGADWRLRVLSPSPVLVEQFRHGRVKPDNLSLVAILELQGRRVLFTGDLTEPGLLVGQDARAEVMKLARAGGIRANPATLLDRVRPALAVASSPRRLSPQLLELLAGRGTALVDLRRDGGTELTFTPNRLLVRNADRRLARIPK